MAEEKKCGACGVDIPSNAPLGLCPRCVLELGLAALRDDATESAEGPALERVRYFGDYELLEQIGRGGMGIVYKARQFSLNRIVAVKMISAGEFASPSAVQRFQIEAEAAAKLDHPNIVPIYEIGVHKGQHYFSMKFVEGQSLAEEIRDGRFRIVSGEKSSGKSAVRQQHLAVARLMATVSRSVDHAHRYGILHRDLKPGNILLDAQGQPHLTDFGLAKVLEHEVGVTRSADVMGTPQYMSPEQATGKRLATATDIYSLGVIFYELLTGRLPFLGTTWSEILQQLAKSEPADPRSFNPAVYRDLAAICLKCLEKEPQRRYDSASALADDLENWAAGRPILARSVSRGEKFWRWCRREPVLASLGATVVIAVLLGLVGTSWQAVRANQAEREQGRLRAGAEKEARRAEAASLESKLTLATSDFLQSVRFIAEGHGAEALPFLARSLSGNPTNDAAVTRLTTLLAYHSWMLSPLILWHGSWANSTQSSPAERWNGRVTSAQLSPDGRWNARVTAAQFSPDGKWIATASEESAWVWDVQSGQALTEPMKHSLWVNSAEFSPDGKRILTASVDKTALVWDAQTGRPLSGPMQHAGEVTWAEFSPDGKWVVTASRDRSARVWNARTGQPLTEPMYHGGEVYSAQFSPDGRHIVTAGDDKTARLWDAHTGHSLTEPMQHGGSVFLARFSPDGKRIVTAATDRAARVWDAQTGQLLTEPMPHSGWVYPVQFSPDGASIVTGSADTVLVWDAMTGRALTERMKHGSTVTATQFSPDGKRIATASRDNTARVWDAQTGRLLIEPMPHGSEVNSVRFSPDGKWIVTASSDGTARVGDARTHRPLTEPMAHGASVRSAQFSPDGNRIVTASLDGTACIWDAQTSQRLTKLMPHAGGVNSARFSPDGKWVVTSSSNNAARVWNAQTGQPLTEPMRHGGEVTAAEFSPDGKRVVTASLDGTACVWDAQTGQRLVEQMKHGGEVISARFSPDGKWMVTGSSNSTACVWNAQSGQPVTGPMQHGGSVFSAQFSPDGKRIVTASRDSTARVWDAQTGQPLTERMRHGGVVNSAQFSPDGKRVVTASRDSTARVWDAHTGQPLTEPMEHIGQVDSAQFSPDGKRIVTGSWDYTARVWDAQTGQPLTEPMPHNSHVTAVQFSPDGKRILTASRDSKARVWDVAPTPSKYPVWLLQLAEAISGQTLNKQGLLEPTRLNRVETVNEIRRRLHQEQGDDDWVVWGRWFLADRATRTISPFSKIMMPEYIEHRIKERSLESLHEAELLAVGNPELLQRISEARRTLEHAK